LSVIWTQCAESCESEPLRVAALRVVESQFRISTRKLVDSDAEQELLERLIEGAKPPIRLAPSSATLHYLLWTPFRYPPLKFGSRFGARHERGIWYGALHLRTALAEVAYYRLVFLEGTAAELGTVFADLTVFSAEVRAERAVDLTRPPFAAARDQISSKSTYEHSQPLGRALRDAGVQAFLFASARDPEGGTNVGLFGPTFAPNRPKIEGQFACHASRLRVDFSKQDFFERQTWTFERSQFEVEGSLPRPAT
jgi:hypothetical protein